MRLTWILIAAYTQLLLARASGSGLRAGNRRSADELGCRCRSAHPARAVMAGGSVFICPPSGLSAPPAVGLGNQAGPSRTAEIAEAGFSHTPSRHLEPLQHG
jgi:hypothetical protein